MINEYIKEIYINMRKIMPFLKELSKITLVTIMIYLITLLIYFLEYNNIIHIIGG